MEFSVKGGVAQQKGVWCGEVALHTPDGKITKLNSGFIYSTEAQAVAAMEEKLKEVLDELKKDGTEIVARNGVSIQ